MSKELLGVTVMAMQLLSKLRSLLQLARIIPVLSWSGGSVIIGAGIAFRTGRQIDWPNLLLICLAGLIFQGFVSHSFNDTTDWNSGTDKVSPGILSGGSKVLPQGRFSIKEVALIGNGSLCAGVVLGIYFWSYRGSVSLLLLALAIWACIAYSKPPLLLAYRPLLGEWLVAFPAMVGFTAGTFFILTGRFSVLALWAGILHGIFSIAWLMQHHIPDIFADLAASPRKLTTPAWLVLQINKKWARMPAFFYFLGLIAASIAGGFILNKVFFFSAVFALPCLSLAWFTDIANLPQVTNKQRWMMAFSWANSLGLGILLSIGY